MVTLGIDAIDTDRDLTARKGPAQTLALSNKGPKKAQCTWERGRGLTWYLHFEERQGFNDKHGNPADSI